MIKAVIFDLDGTLYEFTEGKVSFSKTGLFKEIKRRGRKFISKKLGVSEQEAIKTWERLKKEYNEDISIGVEKEFGINRYVYFNDVWRIDASKYVRKSSALRTVLDSLPAKKVILTNAPEIWVIAVLERLGISDVFDEVFTGEGNVRKPQKQAYLQVVESLRLAPNEILMVGDSEGKDLCTAKKLGMVTVLVGDSSGFADYCIESIRKLPAAIMKENGGGSK